MMLLRTELVSVSEATHRSARRAMRSAEEKEPLMLIEGMMGAVLARMEPLTCGFGGSSVSMQPGVHRESTICTWQRAQLHAQ